MTLADKLPDPDILAGAVSGSLWAYNRAHEGLLPPPEFVIPIADFNTSAEAILYNDSAGRQVIAFKGTAEKTDWFINSRAMPWYWLKSWSHRGFTVATRSIAGIVLTMLALEGNKKELIVTGHSLGGAMAEKFCEALSDYPAPVHLVTFGKPNTRFRPRMTKLAHLATQLSVVHGSDAVARIPRFFYGPDPAQRKLYLANSGIDYMDPDRELVLADWRLSDAFSDHSIHDYVARINYILGRIE